MYVAVAMHLAVVLMNATRSDHPEVNPCDEPAPIVVDLLLRVDIPFCGNMQ